ncbi:MAG: extensin family protein [Myxococcota bacterium]|nr:extensin family protein [Myxococcota bacterium]
MSCARLAFGTLVTLALASAAAGARAGFGAPAPSIDDEPARRYARLDRDGCEEQLAQRGVQFIRVEEAKGVLAPVRLSGPLHGVAFHTGLPASQRASTPWEVLDCRLALALDDFAGQLAAHDVVEVVHYSIYRPPSASWPTDKIASRHPGGLAIDAASFVKKDGSTLAVERDFHGSVGARTCGPGSGPSPATPGALELRQIVCDAAEAKLFNVTLTPDYNRAHRNHFHLELTADARWFMVH